MAPSIDTDFARRLEMLSARELESFYEASLGLDAADTGALLPVAGGVATFLAPGSPLNHAVGLGFSGAMTEVDAIELEEFYSSRSERAVVTLCPLADASVVEVLGKRGWTLSGFENVLVRELASGEHFLDAHGSLQVMEARTEEQRDLWAHVAASAFSAPLAPLPEQLWIAAVAAKRPQSRLFLGYADNSVAGTGELTIEDGVAWLSADATLPRFRGRGLQGRLQRARLEAALEAGCTLAVSEATPGSVSQRNMERLGFGVAYTRVELVAPQPAGLERSGDDEMSGGLNG